MSDYEMYMRRALELARQAEGCTSPNPMVGCVIADADGKIVGEGWHRKAGTPHAEVNAIADMHRGHEGEATAGPHRVCYAGTLFPLGTDRPLL